MTRANVTHDGARHGESGRNRRRSGGLRRSAVARPSRLRTRDRRLESKPQARRRGGGRLAVRRRYARRSTCATEATPIAGSALLMIAAGSNEKTGGATDRHDPAGRLRLLENNAAVYREILPNLLKVAPDAVVLVLTDPPDPLADLVRSHGFEHVLSSGTFLDSLRFRYHLGRHLDVTPASVEADVLGEHGTSEVFLWSSARLGGVQIEAGSDVRQRIEREVRY